MSTFPQIQDPGRLTVRQYGAFLNQAFAVTGWKLSGKIELQTERDKRMDAKIEYAALLKEGK